MLELPISQKRFDFEQAVSGLKGITSPIENFEYETEKDEEKGEDDLPRYTYEYLISKDLIW